ncbi:MFS transporter [Bowdeniella massiliensis]|uniref:MFS transporter n=1 Tax=Bowdeniella massiliensis TaxID=2932264 RepID=UPI00202971F8|nr:MFS transporter [Bowdeniella massiliensis]
MSARAQARSLAAAYRDLFALSGWVFIVVAFIGRVPLAMAQMGTLLMVTAATDSYTAGGTCAGALAVANAIGSPIAGGLTDRIGQKPVVIVQSIVSGLGLLALVFLTNAGLSWPILALAAAAAGFFLPQIGTLARIRWRELVSDKTGPNRERLNTAFSWEGAGDEASFVLGPATVGILTAIINAQFAVTTAAVLVIVFGTWFGLHPTSRLVAGSRTHALRIGSAITTIAALMMASQFLVGTMFGSVQTGTTVLARAAGQDGMAGLLHGVLGIGSVVAGIAIAAIPATYTFDRRVRVFSISLLVLSIPLLFVHSLGWLTLVLAIMGFGIAPLMITNFSVVEMVTPPTRLGVVMTMLASVTGLGYAVGSSTAGRLADWGRTATINGEVIGGYTPAYAVTVTGALLAVIVAHIVAAQLVRRRSELS